MLCSMSRVVRVISCTKPDGSHFCSRSTSRDLARFPFGVFAGSGLLNRMLIVGLQIGFTQLLTTDLWSCLFGDWPISLPMSISWVAQPDMTSYELRLGIPSLSCLPDRRTQGTLLLDVSGGVRSIMPVICSKSWPLSTIRPIPASLHSSLGVWIWQFNRLKATRLIRPLLGQKSCDVKGVLEVRRDTRPHVS